MSPEGQREYERLLALGKKLAQVPLTGKDPGRHRMTPPPRVAMPREVSPETWQGSGTIFRSPEPDVPYNGSYCRLIPVDHGTHDEVHIAALDRVRRLAP